MEMSQQRILKLFIKVKDCSFGTLWWVANKIWQRNRTLRFTKDDGYHPGVSVAANWPDEHPEVVPMLFGTSKKNARAFVASVPPRRESYFICLKPVKLRVDDFLTRAVHEAAPKRRLNPGETERLRAFVKEALK